MPTPLTHDDPHQLGAYRLTARLGSGGMGTVYLARTAGGRTVALKTVHARIAADPAFRTRFRLETDAARVIGGQHGAAVFDADPLADTPWMATEYVLGPPLDEAVTLCGPLPEPSVRALGAALCGALSQLHRSDVVHRDLKPSNVMVTAYGPKVIDFGIARALGDDRLTRTGTAAGTPAYMSPEQATGLEHTPAGDVFALAGVLVFAAAAHGPFGSGRPADLLYRVRYAEPDLTGVPASLVPVLARCLHKDPAQRPTTGQLAAELHDGHGEFADHLPPPLLAEISRRAAEVWLPHPPRLAAPPESPDHSSPAAAPAAVSRRKLLTMGGGSVLGVAAAGAGGWAWWDKRGADDKAGKPSSAAADDGPEPLWRTDIVDKWQRRLPMPLGKVVAGLSENTLRGLDAKSGKELWSYPLLSYGQQFTSDGKAIYGFLPDYDEGKGLSLHAFSPTDGTMVRRVARLTGFNGSLHDAELIAAIGGVLYLAARKKGASATDYTAQAKDWCLVAVGLRSGKKLWQRPISVAYPDNGSRAISATVVGKRLIVARKGDGYADYSVGALDIGTGEVLWRTDIPRERLDSSFLIPGQLAADRQHVYVSSGRVWALRISDGEAAWEFGDDRSPGEIEQNGRCYSPPAVRDGVVYAAEGSHGIVALEATTGKLLWEEKEDFTNDDTPRLTAPPVVGEKYVYAPLTHGVSAVDRRTHRSVWTYATPAIRFVAHEEAGQLIAADSGTVTALPFE
ncbi:serine/threonine-protein kinase [Streptomyces agglomeratus]|nr:serine/threonine-protein kinase [Streptomyces agglomeratus]